MKLLYAIFSILFIAGFIALAHAANTPPPGSSGDIITNGGSGQFSVYGVGSGLNVTTSGGKNYLNSTGTGSVPTTAIIEENGSPIVTETGQYIVEE
jgi:hypothetical protein